ncbi:hypothetical protein GGS21DRAFT_494053 [Xylaria nigripes]|nr:hypothetical protein GGS21DRAFT_494053 [Xylaria nigripes]
MTFDFESRRATVVDGYEGAIMSMTTVADVASFIARAVDYEGKQPTNAGIRGNRAAIAQIQRCPYSVEKVKIKDPEVRQPMTSRSLEAPDNQA